MFVESFTKIADLMPPKMPQASAMPKRVTPSVMPGNPIKGLRGLTGAPAMLPFGRPINRFGTTARKGLVSRTAAIRGVRI